MGDTNTLSERIAALPPEKRKLLLKRLKERQTTVDDQKIPKTSRKTNTFALSPAQERLWFIHQINPDSPLYNLPVALRIKGPLNVDVLHRSLNTVLQRHEILRATFDIVDGEPVQTLSGEVELSLPVTDLRSLSDADTRMAVQEHIAEDAGRPFDLRTGPLMRAALLRLDAKEHVLILNQHHIVSDGWSAGILHRELWSLYDAIISGDTANLPELDVQYVDFAAWQRERLRDDALKEQMPYWREQLGGDLPLLDLPTDRPRPNVQTFGGDRETREFPADLTAALKAWSNQEGVTLFMVLLAAYKTLLYRYSGQEDVIVGTPIAGRNRAEVEDLIGFFVNTLALRTDLAGTPTFRELLQRVQRVALEAYQHQELPFARLVEELQPERDLSHTPLFQAMFVLQENPMQSYEVQNLTIEQMDAHTGTSRFDVTLEMTEIDGRLQAAFDYNTALFDAATIRRMLGHFQMLLERFVADPDQHIAGVDMLTEAEREQLLIEWNDTERPYPSELSIHKLFERQAERYAESTAVTSVREFDAVYAALESGEFNPAVINTLSGIYAPMPTADDEEASVTDAGPPSAQVQSTLAGCCFQRNAYVHRFHADFLRDKTTLSAAQAGRLTLLATHAQILVAISENVLSVLNAFDGTRNLQAIAEEVGDEQFVVGLVTVDTRSNKFDVDTKPFRVDGDYRSWIPFIRALHVSSLIELVDYNPNAARRAPATLSDGWLPAYRTHSPSEEAQIIDVPPEPDTSDDVLSPVLIVGATTGAATTGVMYLASYLRRHGIEAYCQLNDVHTDDESLERNVRRLIETYQPELFGVSIKWFPHIARGLKICELVKKYSPDTQIVLGGDTATYFCYDLIDYDTVDYIVMGDGEIPLLKICRQAEQIPNCLYKRDGEVVSSSISYLHQDDTLSRVYLSHLDEIFTSPTDLALTPYVFVFTGRGCPMNCEYCGGAREVQVEAFNRPKPYSALRGVREARSDIIRLKEYTSTFLFDFDTPNFDSLENYRALWEGIDLSEHFGYFYFWYIPSAEFIELVTSTFKFVSLNIDLNSLSERHRKYLTRKRFGKPQPSDEEILDFFDACEQYDNVETTINLINGLPYFKEEDIAHSEQLLKTIMSEYSTFVGLGWGRLHAQPGAPITRHYEEFDMQPTAVTFEDFLHYSELNMEETHYPDLASLHYPIVYYQDDDLNAKVTKHYVETMQRVRRHLEETKKKLRLVEESLSYRELNQTANRLARCLRDLGVAPEVLVGIHLDRSLEMVIAALAVLKAGGAYVPLDPSYPEERLSFMMTDARVDVLLTTEQLADHLDGHSAEVVCLDREWERISQRDGDNLDVAVAPDNLAYVLYTSGSTGKPKGVMVQHQGVPNLAQAQAGAFDIDPSMRVLQFAPFSFDASVSEIFVTLLSGATLCMAPQELLMPGPDLIELLQEQEPNVLTCPPSVLAALPDENLPHLRTLVSAGEACTTDVVSRWAPGRRFINAYGPTEGTVCATLTEVQADAGTPSIGGPIDNTSIFLLNEQLQPVPVGVPGEIYIGGAGLARGYYDRAGLTAERFVPNPFSDDAGARLYKTGDLARWRPDGTIEFLGRIDNQVKIRGSRVEIGEVEAALAEHPELERSAVDAWTVSNETRLIAYVVPKQPGEPPATGALRDFMARKVPDYMVPYAFMTLDELPLLPNGKVDRSALPEPDRARPALADDFVAPRDAVEELVAEIWEHYLGIDDLGIYDNFFELGGHSLLITQVLSQLAEVFQVELPARVFLETPTVAGVASALHKYEPASGQVDAIARYNKQISEMSTDEIRSMLQEKKQAREVTFNGF